MLKINGVKIKSPQEFKVSISDIDGQTTRNAKGSMIRDRIAVKRKLECKFPPLRQSEISVLLKAVKNEFFTVEYPDPELGVTTKTMYVGDRTIPMYRHGNGGEDILWENLDMNFVEK